MRTEVTSSLLKSIAYSPATRVLEVEFRGRKEGEEGKVYRYTDVSQETYDRFMAAPSLGSHFLKNIKNHHEYTRVEEKNENANSERPEIGTLQTKKEKRKPFQTATDDENVPF
jgi:hypothetical protein